MRTFILQVKANRSSGSRARHVTRKKKVISKTKMLLICKLCCSGILISVTFVAIQKSLYIFGNLLIHIEIESINRITKIRHNEIEKDFT